MTTIAVTGAAGAVGRRVVEMLADQPTGEKVVAVDRVAMRPPSGVDFRLADLTTSEDDLFAGCDSVIHLAEDPGRRTDPAAAVATLDALLERVASAGCPHVVVLSSALVYGARAGNPVPLTEHHDRRPNPDLGYAVAKATVEERAERWADVNGVDLAVLRPTTTLSERGASYVAVALRAALAARDESFDAPLQFLHHDDLASAVALVASRRERGIFNVAPDHWIEPEEFRHLLAEIELPRPARLNTVAKRLSPILGVAPGADLVPYVSHPWVVANDRLKGIGWRPTYTNEEAFVVGTPTPPWRELLMRHRQEMALVATGLTAAAALAGAGLVARWFIRSR